MTIRVPESAAGGRSLAPQTGEPEPRLAVQVEPYPYPYRAMLAVCSDLDLTPDMDVYVSSSRYLNTRDHTSMGTGVGLEVGNTMYFDMPPGQLAYWNTDDAGRAIIHAMMRSGHIDCIHSFGDLARTRAQAERSLEALVRNDCRLEVWVDHSKAATNIGPDIMVGTGDVPGSAAYHTDLTLSYGIRYVWRGRTTGVIGQDAPVDFGTLASMLNPRHPIASTTTIVKEAVKAHLGMQGHPRWEMYGANEVCRPGELRDGRIVWEFLRSNSYWGGSGRGDRPERLADVITEGMLHTLVRREGATILYAHLGKVEDRTRPFGDAACTAFRRLASAQEAGMVLVASTHRLLRFLTVRNGVRINSQRQGDGLLIHIDHVADPVRGAYEPTRDDVQGLTFRVPRCPNVTVEMSDGTYVPLDILHRGDHTFACIPWRRLEFPAIR